MFCTPSASSSKRVSVAQPTPSQISCRVHSATRSQHGISSCCREEQIRLSAIAREAARRKQKSKQIEALRFERARISRSPFGDMKIAHRQEQSAKHSPITPSYSRAALSPFLSSTSKIDCLMSTSNPGGCEQLLQKLSRSVAIKNQRQINDRILKRNKKTYSLSPSWCSPKIQTAAYKHNLSRSNTQRAHNDILSVFLKNNGGYLDDSDDEDDEEEEEEEEDDEIFYSPVTVLKTVPTYPLQFRTPSSTSSSQISSSSGSTRTSSNPPINSSWKSSPQYFRNRVQPAVPVSLDKTGARFFVPQRK